MISYNQAIESVRRQASLGDAERLPLISALGRFAAETVYSQMDVPGFRNSAMDGYAVRSDMLEKAGEACPVTLPCVGLVAAGEAARPALPDVTMQIMTGAPVPEPFDAVVPLEMVKTANGQVTFAQPAYRGEHVRFPGEDIVRGQAVLACGREITPEVVMLLAALGVATVAVRALPKLHVISTGDEIVDEPGSPLGESAIYNCNAPYLLACARSQGMDAVYGGLIQDDPGAFEEKIRGIDERALIISTGAVSKGSRDFLPVSLHRLGATVHFHRVAIRPGKPIIFATLPNGSYYFGLPGNPISAAVGFVFFVMPLLCEMQGRAPPLPLLARLTADFEKRGDFRQFLKANLAVDGKAGLLAKPVPGQESFKILPMAQSNAWIVLDESKTAWKVGDIVPVHPYGASTPIGCTEDSLCKAA